MPKLEPYSRKLDYSYQLGVFPSLMLLEARPECALRLLLHPQGLENEGVVKLREQCAALGVREELAAMKRKKLIKEFIPGEDFGPMSEASRKLAANYSLEKVGEKWLTLIGS